MSQQGSQLSRMRAQHNDNRTTGDIYRPRNGSVQKRPACHPDQLLGRSKASGGTGGQNNCVQTVLDVHAAHHGGESD